MTEDPIVAEVRAARERYAAQFGFDLAKIVDDLRRRQAAAGRAVVSFPPRRPDRDTERKQAS